MAHFAKVKDGIVTNVIVAEQEFIDNLLEEEAGTWIKTSYNTYKGEHKLGGTPLRKNFAGVGFIYDKQRDAFYQPQPYASWKLDEETCHWEVPTPMPTDGKAYKWNEENLTWDVIE